MNENTHPLKRSDSIQYRDIDGHIFLIDDDRGGIHALDVVGSAVWRVLDEPMSLKEIVSLFQTAFPDRPKSAVRKEISKFANELVKKDLLCKA